MLECRFKPGTIIELGQRGDTEYDSVGVVADTSYSVEDVYGPGAVEFAEVKLE